MLYFLKILLIIERQNTIIYIKWNFLVVVLQPQILGVSYFINLETNWAIKDIW